MKRAFVIVLLASIFVSISYGQGRSMKVIQTKADSLHQAGNMEMEIIERLNQTKLKPKDARKFYNYAGVMSFTRENDTAFHYLDLALKKDTIWDFFSTVEVLMDADLYFIAQDDRWGQIEDEVIKRVENKKEMKFSNLELSKKLWRMRMNDQAFYKHIKYAKKKDGPNSPLVHSLWELKKKINKENQAKLEEIIANNGWPKQTEVGVEAASTAFYILQHADLAFQKKYYNQIEEAANAKELPLNLFAMFIDRVKVREGLPQIYGTQVTTDKVTNITTVSKIENPEFVNSRRKEVGLGPIEDYLKRAGLTWDIEQKEKN